MKKLFFSFLFLASVGATFIGCKHQNNELETFDIVNEKSVVNSNFQDIISEVEQFKEVKSMALVDERVFKTDFYKILVLDFESSESCSSVLIVLHLDDGYATLMDSRSIRFAAMEGLNISGSLVKVSNEQMPYQINGKTVLICGGESSFWTQILPAHFHCDCSDIVDISNESEC